MIAPYVTNHAVVRFCQRVQGRHEETIADLAASGIDLDEVRQRIADIVRDGVQNGCPGVTWKGFRFILTGIAVKTVLTRQQFYSRHTYFARRETAEARV